MRCGFLAGLSLLAVACSPAPAPAPVASVTPSPTVSAGETTRLCIPPASREIAFTAPTAKDVLTVEAIGTNCHEASLHFSIRKANGDLVWSYAVPAAHTWAFIPDDDQPLAPEKGVATYQADVLKALDVKTTAAAPDWPKGKERPAEPSGLFITADDTRDFYVEKRAKGQPMFCFEPTMGIGRCFFYSTEDNYADAYYEMHS